MLGSGRVVADGSPAELKARAGDDWLEVSTVHEADADRLRGMLSQWSAGEITIVGNRVRVPLADRTASVIGASAALRDAGLEVRDIAVRTPTLDEVFLQVTGHTPFGDAPDDARLHTPPTIAEAHK
ncbi:DUF4162 domain-containing protein [Gordonia sp. HS-NH1]|uniref:ATP-binding protein DrrA1-3 family domain-containing protein n=1 Tax=Gordonia sp. HS-NH1 TaxID=1435068 RepID=UPI001E32F3CE|nr:DUF4162 domain-containing protein [Gordonia sp. HS-NH1]